MSHYQQETQTSKHQITVIPRKQERQALTGSGRLALKHVPVTETNTSFFLQTLLWLTPSVWPRPTSSEHMCRHCPCNPLSGLRVPGPISTLYSVTVRYPCFPNMFHFEVVFIYLHCWLSTTTKAVNPCKIRPTNSLENKYKILFQVAGSSYKGHHIQWGSHLKHLKTS